MIDAVIQLSHWDQRWGLNPEIVVDPDYGHLRDQIQVLSDLQQISDIHIVTGESSDDNRIAQFDDSTIIHRLNREKYSDPGFLHVIESFDQPYTMISSGYFAFLPEELLKALISPIAEKDIQSAQLAGYRRQHAPCLMDREILASSQDHFPEGNFFSKHDPMANAWMLQFLPPWIIPGLIYLFLSAREKLDLENIRPNRFREIIFPTSCPEEPISLNEKNYRPLVSTPEESNFWSGLKEDSTSDSGTLKRYFDSFYFDYPDPLCVQLDLPSNTPLLPGHSLKSKEDSSDISQLVGAIDRCETSRIYKNMLNVGVYNDPSTNQIGVDLLSEVNELDRFFVSFQTRGLNSMAESIMDFVDELSLHIGGVDEETYECLYDNGNYESVIGHFREIQKKWKKDALNTINSLGTEHILSNNFLEPNLVLIYHVTNKLLERGSIQQIFDNWQTQNEYVISTSDQLEEHGRRSWEPYLESKKSVFEVVLREITGSGIEAPDYEPLQQFPCRRLQQAIYIAPDGSVYGCDQIIDEDQVLSHVEDNQLNEIWRSDKRHSLFEQQQNGHYESHEDCHYWYQPVI